MAQAASDAPTPAVRVASQSAERGGGDQTYSSPRLLSSLRSAGADRHRLALPGRHSADKGTQLPPADRPKAQLVLRKLSPVSLPSRRGVSRLRPRQHFPVPRQVRPRRRPVPRPLTTPCEGGKKVATRRPFARKPFVSSIPLWMRTDQPRQQGMDYWKGPHSKIISGTPGMEEYRQIHLAENNPGLWPAISGVETVIPAERRIDGVAEITFTSVLSPLRGRKQTRLAYKDEVN